MRATRMAISIRLMECLVSKQQMVPYGKSNNEAMDHSGHGGGKRRIMIRHFI